MATSVKAVVHDVVDSDDMRRLAAQRELQPYNRPPRAMYIGAPGKVGYLRMRFERGAADRSVMRQLRRMAPLIVQHELYCDEAMPTMPVVYILSSGGPNVDGDRYKQEIAVGPGAMAHVTTGAATKIAEMRDNYSALCQRIDLAEEAYLELMPEPVIPCRSSRYATHTTIVCHPTASLLYSEIYTCGRKHRERPEIFAYDLLSATVEAQRPDGHRLFREKLVIEPGVSNPTTVGLMGRYHMMANVVVLAPAERADAIYAATTVGFSDGGDIATAITRLPDKAGLLFRAMGMETEPIKRTVRTFTSMVRTAIKSHPLPTDFPWR